jgi:hypothetical protein
MRRHSPLATRHLSGLSTLDFRLSTFFSGGSEESVDELADSRCATAVVTNCNQPARVGALDPVLGFVRRATREEKKALFVPRCATTHRLGDVRADRVRRANELHPDGPLVERRPIGHSPPQVVGQGGRFAIRDQVLGSTHASARALEPRSLPRESRVESRESKGVGRV